jgi:hypothetical protein
MHFIYVLFMDSPLYKNVLIAVYLVVKGAGLHKF